MNVTARRAGCDKQLVCRYFGGLEGLFDAIGADLATWVSDRLGEPDQLAPATTYAALMERFAISYLRALRDDPLMQKIVAWEISEASPYVRLLAEVRSRGLSAWIGNASRRSRSRPRYGRTP